jgi:spore coat polysaccharide biosynthesis protein SpsF (cytidylyltransferase family)
MGSTRLPNMVMKAINGVPMIELLLAHLSQSKELDQIVVVNLIDTKNILIVEHDCRAKKNNEESLYVLGRMSERVC